MIKTTGIFAALLTVLSTLPGCAVLSSENSKFACPASTEGVRCYSAKQVYGMTNNSSSVKAMSPDDMAKNLNGASSPAPQKAASNTDVDHEEQDDEVQGVILPEADKPLPVRMNAKVIRVKVFPYEDEKGVFHAGDYLFTEVEGRKWTLTPEQTSKSYAINGSKVISPLQAMPQGKSAMK